MQNGNAYVEGVGAAFDPMKPFWANRNPETERPVRDLLKKETTIFQYTHGTKDLSRINPDSYTVDQLFLDRPGNDTIQLNLLHNYQSNLALYDGWHEFFRNKQPKMLIVWGKNDPFFTVEGAQAYLRDIPKAELHLLRVLNRQEQQRKEEGDADDPADDLHQWTRRRRDYFASSPVKSTRSRNSFPALHCAANRKVLCLTAESILFDFHFELPERMSIMKFSENATVVVVHGAWADGSSWQAIVSPLEDRGLNVIAAPIPLTSLNDAVALKRTIARTQGPVIVAGMHTPAQSSPPLMTSE